MIYAVYKIISSNSKHKAQNRGSVWVCDKLWQTTRCIVWIFMHCSPVWDHNVAIIPPPQHPPWRHRPWTIYSTVTDLAKLRGQSTCHKHKHSKSVTKKISGKILDFKPSKIQRETTMNDFLQQGMKQCLFTLMSHLSHRASRCLETPL